uniref:Uncharacterized protein n=1 Tax=Ciona intestinalis TaxID=7719 RepID=H2XVV4_CIOIN
SINDINAAAPILFVSIFLTHCLVCPITVNNGGCLGKFCDSSIALFKAVQTGSL